MRPPCARSVPPLVAFAQLQPYHVAAFSHYLAAHCVILVRLSLPLATTAGQLPAGNECRTWLEDRCMARPL